MTMDHDDLLSRCVSLTAVLLLAVASAASAQEASGVATPDWKRRAVVVGISDYPEGRGWVDLEGAIHDARAMHDILLQGFGFQEEEVVLLLDGAATRQAILDAFREHLIEPADPKTLAVFYYAGHGSQVADVSGDEPDGFDETLVPVDTLGPDRTRHDILDDELGELFDSLASRTPYAVGIFDCCHSGTASRGAASPQVRVRRAPRFEARGSGRPAPATPSTLVREAPVALDFTRLQHKPVCFGACQDGQEAVGLLPMPGELDEQRGLFTLALEQALTGLPSPCTWRDLYDRVLVEMRRFPVDQQPLFDGPWEGFVFAGAYEAAPRRFPVLKVLKGGEVLLNAGRLQGLRPGTRLLLEIDGVDAIPAEIVELQGPAQSRARLLVDRDSAPRGAQLLTAHAVVAEGPERGAGLKLLLPPVETLPETDPRRALPDLLSGSHWFDVRQPRVVARGQGDASALRIQWDEDSGFEVLDASGTRILPLPPLRPVLKDGQVLTYDLQAFAVWRSVRDIDNRDASLQDRVDVGVEFGVLSDRFRPATFRKVEEPERGPDGAYVVVDSPPPSPAGRSFPGLRLTIRNRHEKPLYLWGFDLTPNWAVTRICPHQAVPDQQPFLSTGFQLAAGEEYPITLVLSSDGYPEGVRHPEMIKLFLTEQPGDFRYVESRGLRPRGQEEQEPVARTRGAAGRGGKGSLSRLLEASMSGQRGAGRPADPMQWTTWSIEFRVLPAPGTDG